MSCLFHGDCSPLRPGSLLFVVVAFLISASTALAEGELFIIGGGLRPNNASVFERLVADGGGALNCRIAIFPTASSSLESSHRFSATLQRYQVPANQIAIIDVRPSNAAVSASDAANIELLKSCNIFYFMGGNQHRITQSLLNDDGSDTPVLAEIRTSLAHGGIVAGTSAGAAMQSRAMLAVSGLPDEIPDEGMDALDFGCSDNPGRRGLSISPGLSFFHHGIVDQHFGQYRGRLGRLSRAVIEQNVRYGFGIDENTALIVSPSGLVEVCGTGYVTIVDANQAKMVDGPLGCRIDGLRVSSLANGDQFDPATSTATISERKQAIDSNSDLNRGHYLITDIAGNGAVREAMFRGLAGNTNRKQAGIWLRYSGTFGHGYRFTFEKTDRSRCWSGTVGDVDSYSVQDIALTIEPVVSSLQSLETMLPHDVPSGSAGVACQSLWFRGIMAVDSDRRLHPDDPVTRADLAMAIASAIHLLPPAGDSPVIADLPEDAPLYDAVAKVLNSGLLELDDAGKFRPDEPISRQDAAQVLLNVFSKNGGRKSNSREYDIVDQSDVRPSQLNSVVASLDTGLMTTNAGRFRPGENLTRLDTAEAIFQILDFRWKK